MAFALDPFAEIRIEIESGTEGSFKLTSIIKAVRDQASNPTTLRAAAISILAWLGMEIGSYTVNKALDAILQAPLADGQNFTPEQREQIASEVKRIIKSKIGAKEVSRIYREVQADSAIVGVGGSLDKHKKPAIIVPRSEFQARGEAVQELYSADHPIRIRIGTERVALVSPVLVPGHRKWKFSFHEGEFGAAIKDEDFLDRVLSGREPIPMSAGITMTVELSTKEEWAEGAWQIIERNVTRVLSVQPAPRQTNLNLMPTRKSHDDQS